VSKFLNSRADPQKLSDVGLIEKYQQTKDQHLVVVLMERYAPQISGMAFRYFRDRDDIMDFKSDLFEKLVRKLDEIDVDNIRQPERWLCRLISNSALDGIRRKKTYRGHTLEFAVEREAAPGSDSVSLKRLDNPHLHAALTQLSAEERNCLEKIYFKEMSYQEIMKETGFTFNQVRGYRDRAIRRLRDLLKDDFSEYFSD
jgi:RNA polymerase sigma-70 factor (ECF subfamily)